MDERKALIKQLDSVYSQVIRKSKYCKKCATTSGVEPAHIFSRSCMSVRWDLDNSIPLCRKCHSWTHRNTKQFKDWVRKLYGDERYDNLVINANSIKKFTIDELKILQEKLNVL